MKVRLLNVHSDNRDVPIIKIKGAWLKEQGFKKNSRIAVCTDNYGRLKIINLDVEAQKLLEEEFMQQVIIEKE